MYSRYDRTPEKPLRIPDNYSGYAFADTRARQEIPRQIDVAKPTPAPPKEEHSATTAPAEPRKTALEAISTSNNNLSAKEEKTAQRESLSLSEHISQKSIVKGFPFGHGIGFDELLLIGLIVLLHGSEQGSDIILWLILLLFMG